MSRYFVLFILALCICGSNKARAQKADDDIIKIKNGPTIYGGLDSIKRDTVFFSVNGKIPVTYPISQIEEFRKVEKYNVDYSKNENPYYNKNSVNPSSAKPDSSKLYISINMGFAMFRAIYPKITVGYRLHSAFIPILSADYTWYNNAPGRFAGITGGITGSPLKDDFKPYYSLQFGYGINQTTTNVWDEGELLHKSGGLKMDIGFGLIKPIIDSKNRMSFGLNYGTQEANYQYNSTIWNWSLGRMENVLIDEKIKYNRLYFTLGVIF